jgi:hypothetical protein
MQLTSRTKSELTRILKKLADKTFEEEDIKILLIQWRPHFKQYVLIWELACFMAHTEARDRGVFHKELDSRYAKMVYGRTFGGPFNKQLDIYSGKNGVIDHPKTVDIDQSFSFA